MKKEKKVCVSILLKAGAKTYLSYLTYLQSQYGGNVSQMQSFLLTNEFSSVILPRIYITALANTYQTQELADMVTVIEKTNPDSVIILMGDFNHTVMAMPDSAYNYTSWKTMLPTNMATEN